MTASRFVRRVLCDTILIPMRKNRHDIDFEDAYVAHIKKIERRKRRVLIVIAVLCVVGLLGMMFFWR